MTQSALVQVIEFLEERAELVRTVEAEAEKAIETEGQRAYQVKMEEKAELLASLGEDAWSLTKEVEGELGEETTQRLEQFSMSASASLRIGSVFFMSALLYPEDHQPGEPNDLETFIEDLKRRGANG